MNINDMVHFCNRTIKNILHNFIPHEVMTCVDRDPPWINNSIKRLIREKNEVYKRSEGSNNNSQYFENFQSLQNLLGVSIEASKERRLEDAGMQARAYEPEDMRMQGCEDTNKYTRT